MAAELTAKGRELLARMEAGSEEYYTLDLEEVLDQQEAWLSTLVVELGRLEKLAHDAGDRRLTEELAQLADKVIR